MTDVAVSRLSELEAVIERGIHTFVEVGEALLEIRDGRLYRESHESWDAYLEDRWNMSRSRAHRLIEGAEVAAMLPTGNVTSERVARELVPVMHSDPASLPDVLSAATEAAGGMAPTAAIVRAVVRERFRSMAAESEAELQEATAHWTPEQRAAVAPERMRQKGELMRLTGDIAALPEPSAFVAEYRDLPPRVIDQAEAAHAWLTDFLNEWRHVHGH